MTDNGLLFLLAGAREFCFLCLNLCLPIERWRFYIFYLPVYYFSFLLPPCPPLHTHSGHSNPVRATNDADVRYGNHVMNDLAFTLTFLLFSFL